MRVTFLLPRRATTPTGGHRVAYEYANRLAARGHRVTVVHVSGLSYRFQPFKSLRRYVIGYLKHALRGDWRPDAWFAVRPDVRLTWIPFLHAAFVPAADVCIATWWQTAERLARFPSSKGRKFYLIQHLETWGGPRERVLATWRAPLKKIVIARWLQEFAHGMGEEALCIPNGLDFERFGLDVSPADRDGASVAMMHHLSKWKGSADGIQALEIVRRRHPELRVELFGIHPRPATLPDWVLYHHNPTQAALRAIYNRNAIFLAPSHAEGWGLTASEAMMCGAAVVATDTGGHREFCIDGETALLVPAGSPERLAESIETLVGDASLRRRLADAGHTYVRRFTWQRSVDALEAALCETASRT